MKSAFILTLLVAATACATSSTPPRAEAFGIGASQADFTKYQTFAFGPANPPSAGYQTNQRSMLVQNQQSMLEKRGYVLKADQPDLVVKISAGSGTLAPDVVEGRDGSQSAPAGIVGIDAYDGRTGAYVWHASAFAEVDREHIDRALLARGVDTMLADFPARQAQPAALSAVDP